MSSRSAAPVSLRVDNQVRGASLANHRHRRLDRSPSRFARCRVSRRDQSLRPSHTVVTSQTVRRRHVENALAADDQVRVAELVPQVSGLAAPRGRRDRGATTDVLAAGGGDHLFEHRQMRGVRLVEAGDHAVHRTQRPIRRDHEARPALAGRRGPRSSVTVSSARTTVVPTAIDAMACAPRRVDALGRFRAARDRTPRTAARDLPGWRRRCGAAAARSGCRCETSRVTSSGVNGRAGRRHLRAARLGGEHRLIHRRRPGCR